ncbi:MAG TPA: amino acid permease [Solirubrobacteraceae bacterium]|jgi:amino acid transporter|nr:amino acid permease [Solirubrobacteraceae bacterium]
MSSSTETLTADEQKLADLGYKQELNRGWSGFSNFAISFSIICILAGCFTTYGQALKNGGPIAISIAWPLISVMILFVAWSMSELASAMPTAGGIYYWASRLGGPGWGWFTGWFNLIGLVAVVASVVYVSATFLMNLLGLYGLHFIFNFPKAAGMTGSANVHYSAHVNFALFAIILILAGLVNVFRSHLVSIFLNISVWWNVVGVAVIVVILIAVPSHHASFSYVFGHRANESGFAGGSIAGAKFWLYVLPLGFLLTMYTITGYDASAHVSEETHGAEQSAPRGIWLSVFYSAIVGWIVLLAITFAIQKSHEAEIYKAGFPALTIFTTALSSSAAKAVILISTIGQLFCGMACVTSASRMTFAFSRDGAVPGHRLWRRLGQKRTPTWAVFFVCVFALVVTIPAYFPNHLGTPVAFLAVTSISVIGLYIAYTIPVFLRWRKGDEFVPGTWNLGSKYKWINPIACLWVALCVIIFCLPFTPEGVPWESSFNWSAVNYAPLVTIGVMLAVTIWYAVSAKNTFKGPVRTIDELDLGLPAVAEAP